MARERLESKLAEIRAARDEVVELLQNQQDDIHFIDFPENYWKTMAHLMWRYGDHMREHTNQIANTRRGTGLVHSEVQRKLADAERSWGELLGELVGLDDADLDKTTGEEDWSVSETLDHILSAEIHYLNAARKGLQGRD